MVYLPPYYRSTPPAPSPTGASSPSSPSVPEVPSNRVRRSSSSTSVPEVTSNRVRRPSSSMILVPHSSSPPVPPTPSPTSVWQPTTTTTAWVTTTTSAWVEPPWITTTTTTIREPPVVRPPKPNPVRTTNNPGVTTAAPVVPSNAPVVPNQTSSAYASQTAMNIAPPSPKTDTEGGLPTVAVVGIAVVGVLVVGFVVTVFVMKSRGTRRHKPLGQTDLFDHLPIDPPAPLPPMTTSGYHPQHYMHQNHHQQHDNIADHGGAHQHELDNLYNNTDYHQQMDQQYDHHGADGHHDHHHHDYNDHHQTHDTYQPDLNQGQAHQGNFYDQSQGFSDQGQAYQGQQPGGGGGHQGGIPDQLGANQSGFHDPGTHGISDQGTAYQGQLDHHFDPSPSDQAPGHQNPLTQIGDSQPPALHQSVNMPGPGLGGVPPPMLPLHEVVPDMRRAPKINSASRPPSSQYSMLLASPTNSHATADYGLVDETSGPARGTMAIGSHYSSPPPPQASLSHRMSNISHTSSGYWDETQAPQQQEYAHSPTNKQSLLDQSRYYNQQQHQPLQQDGSYVRPPQISTGSSAIATTAHTSSRVLPVPSPRIATIPPPLPTVPEVRAPQDRNSEAVGAITSTGNVSSINTFDRRHPQTNPEGIMDHDNAFYYNLTSPTARDPQQR
ncbi:hypothetical protein BGZ72_004152 [Mortierella alpina]|nr:hypothetical protein BGZ72_004152 [Mortierella alpina]